MNKSRLTGAFIQIEGKWTIRRENIVDADTLIVTTTIKKTFSSNRVASKSAVWMRMLILLLI